MQQNRSQVIERDGLYELDAGSDVLDSPRYNHDMAPTKVHERTWNKWHITALWVGMSICVPTYTLGGVLTAYFGLSVGEALVAILLANIVVLVPLTLNAFGHQVRHSVPGAAAFILWHPWFQCAVSDPGAGGLRLVRYPDDVRRAGDPLVPRLDLRGLEEPGRHR
jgi:hypothetical protein